MTSVRNWLNSSPRSSSISFPCHVFICRSHNVSELKIYISRDQIAKRVAEIGAQISKDFAGEPLVLLGVLKGAAIFLSDLSRHISLDASFDFISVSSYGNA